LAFFAIPGCKRSFAAQSLLPVDLLDGPFCVSAVSLRDDWSGMIPMSGPVLG
jgi:hypothetical protein